MFNGVGLQSARGSGTSGYVQKNLSHASSTNRSFQKNFDNLGKAKARVAPAAKDPALVDHALKRKIEVELADLQDELEEKGWDEERVEKHIAEEREKRLAAILGGGSRNISGRSNGSSSSALEDSKREREVECVDEGAAKAAEMKRFDAAFGISKNYEPGDSFLI